MDPLSDVLALLKPETQLYAGFDAAGDWSFAFPPAPQIKLAAILHGACWGLADGLDKPIRFEEGDCFLLNYGHRFVLASDPFRPPANSGAILEDAYSHGIASCNGGGELFMISGRFSFTGEHAGPFFDTLPPIVHVPRACGQAELLRCSLEQLAEELKDPQPGGALMATHLIHAMLVQVLRLHLTSAAAKGGWLAGLAHRHIGAAISAIHRDPSYHWTLEELARIAGMSRTVFALRFKSLMGTTAMDYLTRWRMLLAADRLRSGGESISSIAFSVGYESESAFSNAFKRVKNLSPQQYRRLAPSIG